MNNISRIVTYCSIFMITTKAYGAISLTGWSSYLSHLLTNTDSIGIQCGITFFLGILLSLTPCVYPMIPVTIGILHNQSSNNILHNFFRAMAYGAGLATMFAALGLAAAFTGQLFGSTLNNPLIIIIMSALMFYLGLSMMDIMPFNLPQWLQPTMSSPRGSLLSCFGLGAMSGTVASPCISPGLIGLLSIVSASGKPLFGFMLLFIFGIGLSLPLIIIGTFSHAVSFLPRSGQWMVEIKKLFGVLIMGMGLYYIHYIIAGVPFLILSTIISVFLASRYIQQAYRTHTTIWKLFYSIVAAALVAFPVYYGYMRYAHHTHNEITPRWCRDYLHACKKATKHNKLIFIDINTPFCTICKKIEHEIINTPEVCLALNDCVSVMIDASDTSIQEHQHLREEHNIKGVPALLLIDAHTHKLLKQWGPEVYEKTPKEFAHDIAQFM